MKSIRKFLTRIFERYEGYPTEPTPRYVEILRKGAAGIKPRKETDNNIHDYILDGITIKSLRNSGGFHIGYEVFTPATQHFKITDLSELTPETFEKAIAEEKTLRRLESRMFETMTQNFGN